MKKIFEISTVLLVTFVLIVFSTNSIYGSSETLSNKNYSSSSSPSSGGSSKSCVTSATYVFPFWKRVCADCTIHFTDYSTRSQCSQGAIK